MKLIFPELIKDLEKRNKKGWLTYGKAMTTEDGRNGLQDAYEEAIDLAVYLKKQLLEQEYVPKVYAIDMDGTLCYTSGWTESDCIKAKPNKEIIKRVNDLFKKNFIIIHTARKHEMYNVTIKWLDKHKVRYHAIRMEKMPATFYVDDKMKKFAEL